MLNAIEIRGTVIDARSNRVLSDLKVEAWGEVMVSPLNGDEEDIKMAREGGKKRIGGGMHKKLGKATTQNGAFKISLKRLLVEQLVACKKTGKVYFKVFDSGGKLLVDTKAGAGKKHRSILIVATQS